MLTNLLGLLALPLLAYLIFLGVNANRYVLELPLQNEGGLALQIDLDFGDGGSGVATALTPTVRPARTLQTARIEFSANRLARLRLRLGRGTDPVGVGTAVIRSQGDELLGSDRVLAAFGPETFHPAGGLSVRRLADGASVRLDRDPCRR